MIKVERDGSVRFSTVAQMIRLREARADRPAGDSFRKTNVRSEKVRRKVLDYLRQRGRPASLGQIAKMLAGEKAQHAQQSTAISALWSLAQAGKVRVLDHDYYAAV